MRRSKSEVLPQRITPVPLPVSGSSVHRSRTRKSPISTLLNCLVVSLVEPTSIGRLIGVDAKAGSDNNGGLAIAKWVRKLLMNSLLEKLTEQLTVKECADIKNLLFYSKETKGYWSYLNLSFVNSAVPDKKYFVIESNGGIRGKKGIGKFDTLFGKNPINADSKFLLNKLDYFNN